jgi:hypothetical protein
MSEIIHGRDIGDGRAGECLFCHRQVDRGALWVGAVTVVVCRWCVLSGQLGKLIGDAVNDAGEVASALAATSGHAWRSRLLAGEARAKQEARDADAAWDASRERRP